MSFERPYLFSNMMYWFEREFMDYPRAKVDVEGELGPVKGKLVLLMGENSPKGAYQYRANERIGEVLGLGVELFPGEHVAHLTHAREFAERLRDVLRKRDGEFYKAA